MNLGDYGDVRGELGLFIVLIFFPKHKVIYIIIVTYIMPNRLNEICPIEEIYMYIYRDAILPLFTSEQFRDYVSEVVLCLGQSDHSTGTAGRLAGQYGICVMFTHCPDQQRVNTGLDPSAHRSSINSRWSL